MTRREDFPERLRRLAEAVRRSALVHRDVLAARNDEIHAADAAGLSVGAIAKATGLTRGTIQDVLGNYTPGNAASRSSRPRRRAAPAHTERAS